MLNTPNVFFADIDQPKTADAPNPLDGIANFLGGLFGNSVETSASNEKSDFESSVINRIENAIRQRPDTVIRLYRTSNGFRVMIMNETIPCRDAKSNQLLSEFGSDKLYVSLCRSQDCYRARLTPKPWRCGAHQPPVRYPFVQEVERKYFEKWLADYERRAEKYATCVLVGEFGSGYVNETCEQIAELHDNFVLNDPNPLA